VLSFEEFPNTGLSKVRHTAEYISKRSEAGQASCFVDLVRKLRNRPKSDVCLYEHF
jgi:hypothetical protein